MNTKRNLSVSKRKGRSANGGTIPEFACAFTVLVLFVFFPLLNLATLFSIYSAASTLNDLQVREASLIDYKESIRPQGSIKSDIPRVWQRTGLAVFASAVKKVETGLDYKVASVDKYGVVDCWVSVTTSFRLRPFLDVSWFPVAVPGLNAPFDIVITSRRLMEDPTKAPPIALLGGPL